MPLTIDDPAYECLRGYAVFADTGGIVFNNTAGTILTGGVYGAHDGNSSVAIAGKVGDGINAPATVIEGNNLAGDSRARSERDLLGNTLATLTEDYTTLGGVTNGSGGFDYTFEPGVYLPTIGDINFTANDQIVFVNTANTTDPQWIFNLNNLSFTGSDSIVYGPASGKQIYWVVTGSITVDATTTATLKGVFISSGPITFSGSVNLEPGAAYSFDTVTFSQPSIMTGFGYAAICFLEDTPINTDQGILRIDKIVAGVNTINNKRIVAVTKTIDGNTFLVCFKKDSLGENIPSQDTITSRHHAVEYNGEMLEAQHFLDKVDNVVKVDYNGETLYNILMDEHAKITVNNLVCETLNPDHPYSQKYKKLLPLESML